MTFFLDDALRYSARGWSILPVEGKKPMLRTWKKYQSERPSEPTLRRWFRATDLDGLAVVCGPISGGLVVRDFDTKDAYGRWAAQHPDLAAKLPTVETGRGYHVYFQAAIDSIIDVNVDGVHEGELRGCGIVLLPPSKHPGGKTYRWVHELPQATCLSVLDPIAAGLLPESLRHRLDPQNLKSSSTCESKPVQQRRHREQKITEKTEEMMVGVGEIEEIIQSTQPHGPGQRHRAVFELARALKAIPAFSDADPHQLYDIVARWHKMALPVIRTKPFEETWIDFLHGWAKVKYPRGCGPMDEIFERAKLADLPKAALKYEQSAFRLLVRICRELQRDAKDGPFFLGCRTAGRLVGVQYVTASRWLWLMLQDGLLVLAERGGQQGNRRYATRYFYIDETKREGIA